MFSQRSRPSAGQNRLSRAVDEARRRGDTWLDLTVSNPTRAELPYDERAILGPLAPPEALVYCPEPLGERRAREAISKAYREDGLDVPADRVMLTASTSEAYAFLLKLLCDPGDAIAVPAPSYPLFDHLARYEAAEIIPYRLAYDGTWHIDLPSLRAAITGRTKAIFVVSPNNPTGSYLKRDELAALASLGLPVVSDEVFASYTLCDDATRAASALEASDALVFSLGGLSKLAALPQLKAAWIAIGGPDVLVTDVLARLELLGDTFLSVGTPVQLALPSLLASRHVVHDAIGARTRRNFAWLRGRLADEPLTLLRAEGGWYATLRLPKITGEEAWVVGLFDEAGVYVHPGHFFDFDDEPFLVVSLLTPEHALREGVERVVRYVETVLSK